MNGPRLYRESEGARAAAVLGDARAVDAPDTHVHVSDAGPEDGIAVWREPAAGEEAGLGAVIVPAGTARQQFYRLVLACAEDALARGFPRGRFRVQDGRLLMLIQRDFAVEAPACGWEPNTGRPLEWEISVDLQDALAQLRKVL